MRPRSVSKRSAALVVALLAGSGVALAGSAQAAPVVNDHYSTDYTDSFCGYAVSGHAQGVALIKNATPSTGGQFFHFQDNYSYSERWTNPANGKWLTISGNGLFKEVRPVPLGGGVFSYSTIETGRPFTLTDSSGAVVLKDRGNITLGYVFDTQNDGQPGGVQLQDPVVVKVSGPHPAFFTDICPIADRLIGS